jgi:uncharacterized protein YndB with AHSA1/START domain
MRPRLALRRFGLDIEARSPALDASRTYRVYAAASPDQVWRALTDPDLTEQYYFGSRVETDWSPGGGISYVAGPQPVVDGEIVELEEGRRLVTTFNPRFPGAEGIPASTVSWEVTPGWTGELTQIALTHSDFDFGNPAAQVFDDGWVLTLSSLKSLLETGKPLPPPPSG